MKSITYWKLRKIVQRVVFFIKKILYRLLDCFTGICEYKTFREIVIKNTVIETIKVMLLSTVIFCVEHLCLKKHLIYAVDKSIFVPTIIGGIGVAGVILGLYCSNVATIYSSRYANAPRVVANAFQNDKLTTKCMLGIIDYIVFGFVVLSVTMIKMEIGWIVVIGFMVWSVTVIISYGVAGNRSYQLSDVYGLADDANRMLYHIITKKLQHPFFVSDKDFQNHFLKVAEKQINTLKSIQEYGDDEKRSDYTTMTEFMCKNLAMIDIYWKNKKHISRSSAWFRNTQRYQKWHMTSDTDSSLSLHTGTVLRTKGEHDYWWFENEMFTINKASVNTLFKKYDFASLYTYSVALDKLCSISIDCGEANYYLTHVDWFRKAIENNTPKETSTEAERQCFAGLVESISILYLSIILETSKVYKEFDFQAIVSSILKSIDKGDAIENSIALRGRENTEYYEKILTEAKIEGKRITPDWIIEQQIAKEEYVYLNSLLDIVREGMDHAFSLGKKLAEKGLYLEACIIFSRFYEYESKLSRFIEVVNFWKLELEEYHIDKTLLWDNFRLDKLQEKTQEWKKEIPTLLSNCSLHFTLENRKNSDDFPDFLGESYNHICEDAIDAIIKNDAIQFAVDFENITRLMLLYQEYIRSDFIKKKDLYRVEYAYYMFTSPIVEWAQIGGLAVLWGEFHADSKWMECVRRAADTILVTDGKRTDLSEKLIEYIQNRNKFMLGIGGRDILETEWKLDVTNAIRESKVCEYEYGIFGSDLKTDSRLLKSFCPHFMDMGFTSDPSEVFWVTCINPYLTENKRFVTSNSWDRKMQDV